MTNARENNKVNIYPSTDYVDGGNLMMGVETSGSDYIAKFLRLDEDGLLVVSSSPSTASASYTDRYAYNASNQVIYAGKAVPGSAESAAVWQIKKYIYSGNLVTEILYADGDAKFDNIWDNRASLSYS